MNRIQCLLKLAQTLQAPNLRRPQRPVQQYAQQPFGAQQAVQQQQAANPASAAAQASTGGRGRQGGRYFNGSFSVPKKNTNLGLTSAEGGMTVDQLADKMRESILAAKKNNNMTQQQKSEMVSRYRQILGAASSGKLTPQQIAGEWQKSQNLNGNGGVVSIRTNGNVGRNTRGYNNAFDARGRRIAGSEIRVNTNKSSPVTDEYGRMVDSSQNKGWFQAGNGIYIEARKPPKLTQQTGESEEDAYRREYMNNPQFRAQADATTADSRVMNRWKNSSPYQGSMSGTGLSPEWQRETESLLADARNDRQYSKEVSGMNTALSGFRAKRYTPYRRFRR